MPALDLRLGIDVGGTNTDAVVLDRSDRLVSKAKVPTTPDVTSGASRM
jgi:N-methylhydantoinase A/oxoprolinase/acetone carboxylase beta subunit